MSTAGPLTGPGRVRALIREHGLQPRRSLGQNFLIDANVLRIILDASAVGPRDTVIEVGAGLGALTQGLLQRAQEVFAVESDPGLADVLEDELGGEPGLTVVRADAARLDPSSLFEAGPPRGVLMVSNLPYGIAAGLLVDWLWSHPWISRYTVMVQKEVAGRLAASPGGRDYSQATVKVRARAGVRKVADVSRNCFFPRPRVDSTVLVIEPPGDIGPPPDPEAFNRVVSAAFAQRRKKLANALGTSGSLEVTSREVSDALSEAGIDPGARAEQLTAGDFARLTDVLGRITGRAPGASNNVNSG